MRLGYLLIFVFAASMLGILIKEGRPEELEPVTPDVYRLFPSIEIPQQIIGMELVIPEDELGVAVVVEDEASQTWRLRGTEVYVNPEQVLEARDWLGLMPGIRQLNRGDTPADAFGLLPPTEYVVRFQLDDLRVITLYVGNITPGGTAYYVSSSPDSDIVDLVPTDWIDRFVMLMSSLEPIAAPSGESSRSQGSD